MRLAGVATLGLSSLAPWSLGQGPDPGSPSEDPGDWPSPRGQERRRDGGLSRPVAATQLHPLWAHGLTYPLKSQTQLKRKLRLSGQAPDYGPTWRHQVDD
jgi:hypothetical protein